MGAKTGGLFSAPASSEIIAEPLRKRERLLSRALVEMALDHGGLGRLAVALLETLRNGGKVLTAGNGGSAAEAQHFAAELVGRFKKEREPYAALALTTDTSVLTAVANDYGYPEVFTRQLRALGQPGDLLLAFSTSGESENLVHAAELAHQLGLQVAVITGARANRLEQIADFSFRVPVFDTGATQELQMIVSHLLCEIVETQLSSQEDLPWR